MGNIGVGKLNHRNDKSCWEESYIDISLESPRFELDLKKALVSISYCSSCIGVIKVIEFINPVTRH